MSSMPERSGTTPPVPRGRYEIRDVSCGVSASRFFGRLIFEPASVRFEPLGWANKLNIEAPRGLEDNTNCVLIIVARWLPPWMNTGLVLVDTRASRAVVGVALLSECRRREVRRIASALSFKVVEYRTNLNYGGSIRSVSELQRFQSGRQPSNILGQ